MSIHLPAAVLWGKADRVPLVYPPEVEARLRQSVLLTETLPSPPQPPEAAEYILGTWGMPRLDAPLLDRMPELKAVFYAAGSIRGFATETMWDRGIVVTTATLANNLPVADYVVSVILLGLKRFFALAREMRDQRGKPAGVFEVPGNYGAVIGLVSFGRVARLVAQRLRALGCRVQVWDPFLTEETASAAGVERCELETLFATSDVVSLHTPILPETQGLIEGAHLRLMRKEALFVNSSRGAVVREQEMIEVLRERPDLQAVLDVSDPEPAQPDSPLYDLPNVVLTPHIAGSLGRECGRMGLWMVEELGRHRRGEPLRYAITREEAARMA